MKYIKMAEKELLDEIMMKECICLSEAQKILNKLLKEKPNYLNDIAKEFRPYKTTKRKDSNEK